MKNVRRITSMARRLGAVGFALLLVGCSDQQPAEPNARPRLQTSENLITVKSEITLYDKSGRTRSYMKTQQLQTELVGGVIRATVAVPSGGGLRANMLITDTSAASAGYTSSLTPVVGVVYGSGVGNYTKYVTDSTTMKVYKIVARGPMIYNYPIDDAIAYDSRGYVVTETRYQWGAVSGGYALLAQKELSFSTAGALTATVTSYVSSPVTYVTSAQGQPIPVSFGSLLYKVGCYFAPSVAYAQETRKVKGPVVQPYNFPLPGSGCWGEAGILALNTGIIGVESATGVLEPLMIPVYLGSWGAWTHSLWHYLDCLGSPPRCSARTCTGGGGTSW
jgi:hypothetical protein